MVTFPLHELVAGTKFTGSPHDQLLMSVSMKEPMCGDPECTKTMRRVRQLSNATISARNLVFL